MQKLILTILSICFLGSVQAQGSDEFPRENEQIRAQRVAYITQRLQLTAEESAFFWGVQSEHEMERKRITREFRALKGKIPATDAEARAMIEAKYTVEHRILELRGRTMERLLTGVPAMKLVKLPEAEKDFRRDLLRQLRQRHGGQGRPGRGG